MLEIQSGDKGCRGFCPFQALWEFQAMGVTLPGVYRAVLYPQIQLLCPKSFTPREIAWSGNLHLLPWSVSGFEKWYL